MNAYNPSFMAISLIAAVLGSGGFYSLTSDYAVAADGGTYTVSPQAPLPDRVTGVAINQNSPDFARTLGWTPGTALEQVIVEYRPRILEFNSGAGGQFVLSQEFLNSARMPETLRMQIQIATNLLLYNETKSNPGEVGPHTDNAARGQERYQKAPNVQFSENVRSVTTYLQASLETPDQEQRRVQLSNRGYGTPPTQADRVSGLANLLRQAGIFPIEISPELRTFLLSGGGELNAARLELVARAHVVASQPDIKKAAALQDWQRHVGEARQFLSNYRIHALVDFVGWDLSTGFEKSLKSSRMSILTGHGKNVSSASVRPDARAFVSSIEFKDMIATEAGRTQLGQQIELAKSHIVAAQNPDVFKRYLEAKSLLSFGSPVIDDTSKPQKLAGEIFSEGFRSAEAEFKAQSAIYDNRVTELERMWTQAIKNNNWRALAVFKIDGLLNLITDKVNGQYQINANKLRLVATSYALAELPQQTRVAAVQAFESHVHELYKMRKNPRAYREYVGRVAQVSGSRAQVTPARGFVRNAIDAVRGRTTFYVNVYGKEVAVEAQDLGLSKADIERQRPSKLLQDMKAGTANFTPAALVFYGILWGQSYLQAADYWGVQGEWGDHADHPLAVQRFREQLPLHTFMIHTFSWVALSYMTEGAINLIHRSQFIAEQYARHGRLTRPASAAGPIYFGHDYDRTNIFNLKTTSLVVGALGAMAITHGIDQTLSCAKFFNAGVEIADRPMDPQALALLEQKCNETWTSWAQKAWPQMLSSAITIAVLQKFFLNMSGGPQLLRAAVDRASGVAKDNTSPLKGNSNTISATMPRGKISDIFRKSGGRIAAQFGEVTARFPSFGKFLHSGRVLLSSTLWLGGIYVAVEVLHGVTSKIFNDVGFAWNVDAAEKDVADEMRTVENAKWLVLSEQESAALATDQFTTHFYKLATSEWGQKLAAAQLAHQAWREYLLRDLYNSYSEWQSYHAQSWTAFNAAGMLYRDIVDQIANRRNLVDSFGEPFGEINSSGRLTYEQYAKAAFDPLPLFRSAPLFLINPQYREPDSGNIVGVAQSRFNAAALPVWRNFYVGGKNGKHTWSDYLAAAPTPQSLLNDQYNSSDAGGSSPNEAASDELGWLDSVTNFFVDFTGGRELPRNDSVANLDQGVKSPRAAIDSAQPAATTSLIPEYWEERDRDNFKNQLLNLYYIGLWLRDDVYSPYADVDWGNLKNGKSSKDLKTKVRHIYPKFLNLSKLGDIDKITAQDLTGIMELIAEVNVLTESYQCFLDAGDQTTGPRWLRDKACIFRDLQDKLMVPTHSGKFFWPATRPEYGGYQQLNGEIPFGSVPLAPGHEYLLHFKDKFASNSDLTIERLFPEFYQGVKMQSLTHYVLMTALCGPEGTGFNPAIPIENLDDLKNLNSDLVTAKTGYALEFHPPKLPLTSNQNYCIRPGFVERYTPNFSLTKGLSWQQTGLDIFHLIPSKELAARNRPYYAGVIHLLWDLIDPELLKPENYQAWWSKVTDAYVYNYQRTKWIFEFEVVEKKLYNLMNKEGEQDLTQAQAAVGVGRSLKSGIVGSVSKELDFYFDTVLAPIFSVDMLRSSEFMKRMVEEGRLPRALEALPEMGYRFLSDAEITEELTWQQQLADSSELGIVPKLENPIYYLDFCKNEILKHLRALSSLQTDSILRQELLKPHGDYSVDSLMHIKKQEERNHYLELLKLDLLRLAALFMAYDNSDKDYWKQFYFEAEHPTAKRPDREPIKIGEWFDNLPRLYTRGNQAEHAKLVIYFIQQTLKSVTGFYGEMPVVYRPLEDMSL